MKILILGGYGVFGGRLASLLSDIVDAEILICGRDGTKASEFCRRYHGKAKVTAVEMSRTDITTAIKVHQPNIVVDASGPFQDYGDNPYVVVKACIEARVNYLDFADAADFVFGISQFDQQAQAAGVFILSGVSSFPVLTAAVLREMSKDMAIQSVTGGIAPSPYAGIGLNVMRAVVGYAGAPVKIMRQGKQTHAKGLTESLRFTIAPPGHLPLRNLHFSLVDVPDLQVLPPEHESLSDIWMGAAPVPETLHRILNLLAKTRASLHLPSFVMFSPLFYWVLNLAKFGEHRGGMFVKATGVKNGKLVEKSWHLLAEGDDGPFIPSMAIEAIIRKAMEGATPAHGARPATKALDLADYRKLFENRSIFTGFRNPEEMDGPLYQQILGTAFRALPGQLQALHSVKGEKVWEGQAQVSRGKNPFATLLARLFGFPTDAKETKVTVKFLSTEQGERWERNFGGRSFSSSQTLGSGRNTGLLVERFGIISVALATVVKDNQLHLVPRRWQALGIPLPRLLLPSGESFEYERDGVFRFNVSIRAPMLGLIVHYHGWLKERDGSSD
ncbi:DUF4166 domain-containing protein [Kordiimonas sp.]|uniref:DUF4166 domain-containing protein n=1 Tax=Kordiimonas sp. TaxID=1970157 RepID=UPI003A916EED